MKDRTLADVAERLAAIDRSRLPVEIAEVEAEINRIDVAEEASRKQIDEIDAAMRSDKKRDEDAVADALLAGGDVLEASEPVSVLQTRRETIMAGLKSLRWRRSDLQDRKESARMKLASEVGDAMEPLADAFEEQAKRLAESMAALYSSVAAAVQAGSNSRLTRLEKELSQPLAKLGRTSLLKSFGLSPAPELIEVLACGTEVISAARHRIPSMIPFPDENLNVAAIQAGATAAFRP